MNITVEQAKHIVLKKYSDSIVNSVMVIPSGYVVNIQPKNWKKNDTLLGGYFKVSKTDGKMSEYSPVMDPEEFKKALNNVVYKRDI